MNVLLAVESNGAATMAAGRTGSLSAQSLVEKLHAINGQHPEYPNGLALFL
jgi:hypothetical protein